MSKSQTHKTKTLWLCFCFLLTASACGASQGNKEKKPLPDPIATVEAQELFDKAEALERSGDPIRAEQYYAAAISRGHPERPALKGLIRVCIQSSRMKSALTHAEPYLQRNPNDWSLRYLVATIQRGLGDNKNAMDSIDQVLRTKADFPQPYFLKGVIQYESKENKYARESFLHYLRLDPEGRHVAEVHSYLDKIQKEIAQEENDANEQNTESDSAKGNPSTIREIGDKS